MCFACVSVSLCFLQLSEIYLYIFYFLCRMCFLKLCTWPKWSKCFVCPMCSWVKAIPCLCAFCVFCVISAFEIFFLPKEEIYVLFVPYVLLDQSSQVIMWLLCFLCPMCFWITTMCEFQNWSSAMRALCAFESRRSCDCVTLCFLYPMCLCMNATKDQCVVCIS